MADILQYLSPSSAGDFACSARELEIGSESCGIYDGGSQSVLGGTRGIHLYHVLQLSPQASIRKVDALSSPSEMSTQRIRKLFGFGAEVPVKKGTVYRQVGVTDLSALQCQHEETED